eukprot:s1692_g3.t1
MPDLNCELPIPVGNAGPQPRAPDSSGQRQTSTASSRSQWATPDLNCELQISVGTAGPQPRAPDPSGQRRTSTASSRSQWATPDLNRELRIPVLIYFALGSLPWQALAGTSLEEHLAPRLLLNFCGLVNLYCRRFLQSRELEADRQRHLQSVVGWKTSAQDQSSRELHEAP